MNLVKLFDKALSWIDKYSEPNKGISISSNNLTSYPEVTGYFIPTLIKWGEKERALNYAKWLVSIQYENGAWPDPNFTSPYTFDTGQILKGLYELSDYSQEFRNSFLKGCDWLITQIKDDGHIVTPDEKAWEGEVPNAVLLYAIEPLIKGGKKFERPEYLEKADLAIKYYISKNDLTDFNSLSHFHAYIIEALIDLGEIEIAKKGMEKIVQLQSKNGRIRAYQNKYFTCSTGLFQYAVIWYKLGSEELANKTFQYACKLQNKSGGWYGSYGWFSNYFKNAEISWTVKYFLDALWWKICVSFNKNAHVFPDIIPENDGRYLLIEEILRKNCNKSIKILDIGCGKGRFISLLKKRNSEINAFGVDISSELLSHVSANIEVKEGTLFDIKYPDEFFDFAFCVEALEHAVNIKSALSEMIRIIKKDGILLIIDKNADKLGTIKICEWEKWFNNDDFQIFANEKNLKLEIRNNLPYNLDNNIIEDGLFNGWVFYK